MAPYPKLLPGGGPSLPAIDVALARRPVKPWVRRAGLGMVGLWVVWFGAVSLILDAHLVPRAINSHNPVVVLDYASAWT